MIHPLFVHFPIGILVVYALLELFRCPCLSKKVYFFYVKGTLVILGVLAAVFTLGTGESAEEYVEQHGTALQRSIVETHAAFAGVTTLIFGIIAFSYVIAWAKREEEGIRWISVHKGHIIRSLVRVGEIIQRSWVLVPLTILGLFLITITGGLGAVMVYGPDIDPFAHLVYRVFIGN